MKYLYFVILAVVLLLMGLTFAQAGTVCNVFNGCTGVGSFTQGWLYSSGGTNSLAASTSPTVNYITATSTTATSTFAYSIKSPCFTTNGTSCLSSGGTPGGSDTYVQFNDSNTFGGDPSFTYDKFTPILRLGAGFSVFNIRTPDGTLANGVGLDIRTGGGSSGQNGGDIDITTGLGGLVSGGGGHISLVTASGRGSGAGGELDITSGNGGATGLGGNMYLTAGDGGASSFGGGSVITRAGSSGGGATGGGGSVEFYAGDSSGTSDGGTLYGAGGVAGSVGTGGFVEFDAGHGGSSSGLGGDIILHAGYADGGNSNGGAFDLSAGTGHGSGNGGDIVLTSGSAGATGANGHVKIANLSTFPVLGALFDPSLILTSNKTFTFPNMTGTFVVSSTTAASTITYASTTAASATTICLTGDTCRTTWPSGTNPASPNLGIQYNNNGSFGASADFLWDNVNKNLSMGTSTNSSASIYSGRSLFLNSGGDGYNISLLASDGLTTGSTGGTVVANGGTGSTTASGGLVEFIGGDGSHNTSNGTGNGGKIEFFGGNGGLGGNTRGGDIVFFPGLKNSGGVAAGVGIGTSTPGFLFDMFSTGTTSARIDSNSGSKGSCLIMKDSDGSGYTYITANNGVLTASTIACN